MKKPLIAFVIAFALSIGFTFFPILIRAALSELLQSNIPESVSVNTLIGTVFSLVGLSVFFIVFYFLANRNQILAVRPIVIAVLLGVMLGPAILYLANIAAYPHYTEFYLSLAAESSISSIFGFFLPSLTAILFAELRGKKKL